MTLEDSLFTLFAPLVGNRFAPVIFPQPPAVPTWPAIRCSIQRAHEHDICGAGDEDTGNVRVQLDVVAKDFDQVKALARQVKASAELHDPPLLIEFEDSDYDETTKTFREIQQYSVHASTEPGSP